MAPWNHGPGNEKDFALRMMFVNLKSLRIRKISFVTLLDR